MKILVSTICFIQPKKIPNGSEIYATFANRLVESAMTFTNFDIRVATNRPDLFPNIGNWGSRATLHVDMLENNQVSVGSFNQLLKFIALKDISPEYEYVLYLDCDAAFIETVDMELLISHIRDIEDRGYNGMVSRSYDTYLLSSLEEHELVRQKEREMIQSGKNEFIQKTIFSAKFDFYDVTLESLPEEWRTATLPSEHILFLKNDLGRIQKMSDKIAEFNKKLETQVGLPYIKCQSDMESFELGVSARVAGFKFAEIDSFIHNDVMKVKFNGSNWEGIKL